MNTRRIILLALILLLTTPVASRAEFRAGAAVVNVTPLQLPVLVNGSMLSRSIDHVKTELMARAIVVDDGQQRLGIVVVDSCMMPRDLLDEAKNLAAGRTNIRTDHMLISATHTHSAPASMGCLGTGADPTYRPYLREKLAEVLAAAEANLEPAQVGFAARNADEFTALRRWIRRPDRIVNDPFGNPTVRANMHAGGNWDHVTGESGPEDPDLSLISIQAQDGRPLALLANFSMHYFGDGALSADYFGLFCEALQTHLDPDGDNGGHSPLVAIMSHGCSGDIWRRDYSQPDPIEIDINNYAQGLKHIALDAYDSVVYRDDVDLAMAETRLDLKYRVPDQQRLEWAQRVVEEMDDQPARNSTQVYAQEQIILHQLQSTKIVLQALRIGEIGIATTPNETYALTGLKLKLQSPFESTMVIELANGGDGYIPPPEQHWLGGYNTWPARSAGLEIQAEPKITESLLGLLEQISGQPRREFQQGRGSAAEKILSSQPVAWWRMDDFAGPSAIDVSGKNHDALYESGIAFFLPGPRADILCAEGETNRAAHFAGGRLRARFAHLNDHYSVALWFWNGMPIEGRPITGWLFSRGRDHGLGPDGDHLGLGGTVGHSGRLIFLHGNNQDSASLQGGRTVIPRWSWNHVVFVRLGDTVRIYLNGNPQPELEVMSPPGYCASLDQLFFGGRCDRESNWEGRLDEITVYDRALDLAEIEAMAR